MNNTYENVQNVKFMPSDHDGQVYSINSWSITVAHFEKLLFMVLML